jgi:ubiquinone/menaquinone biosynthesis C-methylase UbiE
MNEHEMGQVATSAADVYEQFFIPALFVEWPRQVLAVADVQPGQRVLDVACGTGILAREAKKAVGELGAVDGLDINDGMLAVARKRSASISWHQGSAEALPFESASFDRVVSQFGLMFFQDRQQAIAEMARVLKPGGRGCVAVWASLADTPGYAAVASMLNDLFGAEIAKSIEAPYCLGDVVTLEKLFSDAGVRNVAVETRQGKARFESIESWIYTDIKGWTLADVIDDRGYETLKAQAPRYLSQFQKPDGSIEFESPAHLVAFAA